MEAPMEISPININIMWKKPCKLYVWTTETSGTLRMGDRKKSHEAFPYDTNSITLHLGASLIESRKGVNN